MKRRLAESPGRRLMRWSRGATLTAVAFAAAFFALSSVLFENECRASSREECLEAHSRGQDQRDSGRLTAARQTFLACAQSSCPALVQADCARFGEELDRIIPSVSFAARDTTGADLPDTIAYVDDQNVPLRLDDGKSYDLDPGKHTIRFVHDGHETKLFIVLTQGEKGRDVIATFAGGVSASPLSAAAAPPAREPRRPIGPLFVAGLGAAAAVTGGVLVLVGLREVPSACSMTSHECTAPPGDPSIDQAHRGVTLANFGIGVGAGGAAVLVGGALWYFLQPARPSKEAAFVPPVTPWIGAHSGGVRLSTQF